MKKQLLLLFLIISSGMFYYSCTYKNASIPDLEQYTIDTVITAEDTAGFIYGRLYLNGSELGSLFEVYTVDNYNNYDSILSISTVYKNVRVLFYLNDTSLGVYNATTNLNAPKTCLVLLDANVTNLIDQPVVLNVGNVTLNSFDTLTKVYRGSISVSNVGVAKTYDIRGNFALKMRN